MFAVTAEFKTEIETYFKTLITNPHSIRHIEDLIRFTQNTSGEGYPGLGNERFLWTHGEVVDTSSAKYKEKFAQDLHFAEPGELRALWTHTIWIYLLSLVVETHPKLLGRGKPLGFFPKGNEVTIHKMGSMIKLAPGIP